eukprot:gnl/Spiro4/18445_TR9870_c0_g1_i1.p1 gnl/Spiro4/18445_TR9870_c0_g1~~gnl/Spiro4/18445_TR9870_c0_g1_i1.p1  ORF type:complete len:584 (+),score=143.82 gnl/Spiro4/18445_TR9870_c0_g1_i1:49-1800(+)
MKRGLLLSVLVLAVVLSTLDARVSRRRRTESVCSAYLVYGRGMDPVAKPLLDGSDLLCPSPTLEMIASPARTLRSEGGLAAIADIDEEAPWAGQVEETSLPNVIWSNFDDRTPETLLLTAHLDQQHVWFIPNLEDQSKWFEQLSALLALQSWVVPRKNIKDISEVNEADILVPKHVKSLNLLVPFFPTAPMERASNWVLRPYDRIAGPTDKGASYANKDFIGWDKGVHVTETDKHNLKEAAKSTEEPREVVDLEEEPKVSPNPDYTDVRTAQTLAWLLTSTPPGTTTPVAKSVFFVDIHEYQQLTIFLNKMEVNGFKWKNKAMEYNTATGEGRFFMSYIPTMWKTVRAKEQVEMEEWSKTKTEPAPIPINLVAFPDAGAHARFGALDVFANLPMVYCDKKRGRDVKDLFINAESPACKAGTSRDGKQLWAGPLLDCGAVPKPGENLKNAWEKLKVERPPVHALLVDDFTNTGSTLQRAAIALMNAGADQVSVYVTHGVFAGGKQSNFLTQSSWESGFCALKYLKGIYVTNSIPGATTTLKDVAKKTAWNCLSGEEGNPPVHVLPLADLLKEKLPVLHESLTSK